MAVNDPPNPADDPPTGDLLGRAAHALRDAPNPGWASIRDSVVDAVRAASRPAWPVLAQPATTTTGPDADPPVALDRTLVSTRVLTDQLSRLLSEQHRCAVAEVHLDLQGEHLHAAVLDIVAAQGTDLHALGAQVGDTAADILTDHLGPWDTSTTGAVSVRVTDITRGDPRLT